jgi:hypothetical protein
MSSNRNPLSDTATPQVFSDTYNLKDKLGENVDLRKDVFTEDVIQASQRLIDKASDDFLQDLVKDINNLSQQYESLQHNSTDNTAMQHIIHTSRSIKGQAESLGYEMIAHIANSLLCYVEKLQQAGDKTLLVIQKHIESMHVAQHQQLKGRGGALGDELLLNLDKLVKKIPA